MVHACGLNTWEAGELKIWVKFELCSKNLFQKTKPGTVKQLHSSELVIKSDNLNSVSRTHIYSEVENWLNSAVFCAWLLVINNE